jgi:hypothetical protein
MERMAESKEAAAPCPRCLQMRTKMDFVTIAQGSRPSGRPAEWDEDETLGGTAHRYYCRHTMSVIGPDGDIVGPRPCAPGRACYESSGF